VVLSKFASNDIFPVYFTGIQILSAGQSFDFKNVAYFTLYDLDLYKLALEVKIVMKNSGFTFVETE